MKTVVSEINMKKSWIYSHQASIHALLNDVEIVADGGSTFRFIMGRYGSGKSFLFQTLRTYVMDRDFVVIDADLSPERRFSGNKGQGLATYKELMKNMSTKTKPEGGALPLILDRWISSIKTQVIQEGLFGIKRYSRRLIIIEQKAAPDEAAFSTFLI